MLSLVIEGITRDWNDIKKDLKKFGEDRIIYSLAHGRVPRWMLKKTRLHDRYLPLIKNKDSSIGKEDEFSWLKNLSDFYNKIETFNPKPYEELDQRKKEIYSLREADKYVLLLTPLVKGHVDLNNPICPASPKAFPNAKWEHWEHYVNPANYKKIIDKTIYVENEQGIRSPEEFM